MREWLYAWLARVVVVGLMGLALLMGLGFGILCWFRPELREDDFHLT